MTNLQLNWWTAFSELKRLRYKQLANTWDKWAKLCLNWPKLLNALTVVQTLDSPVFTRYFTIQRIHVSIREFSTIELHNYPVDRDLSGGWCYPPFEQLGQMIKYKSVNQPPASPTDRLLLVVMTDDVSSFSNKSGTSSVEPPIPKS